MKSEKRKLVMKVTAPWVAKVLIIVILVYSLFNLYWASLSDSRLDSFGTNFFSILKFNFFYPENLIATVILLLIPGIYYGFIRGTYFYNQGIVINRGLPWFNRWVSYSEIESFRVVNKRFLIALKFKESDDEVLLTIARIDRVMAIMDQNLIRSKDEEVVVGPKKIHPTIKISVIVLITSVTTFVLQHFGLFTWYN